MIWRPVVGYEGKYWVSDSGLVKSSQKQLAPCRRPLGYLFVGLYGMNGEPRRYLSIHRLVLEAFVGPAPSGMEAAHRDGSRTNNALENLRWATPLENARDRDRHGRTVRGSNHKRARLTEQQVAQIRSSPKSLRVLAREFGVSFNHIGYIKSGKSWQHIEPRSEG